MTIKSLPLFDQFEGELPPHPTSLRGDAPSWGASILSEEPALAASDVAAAVAPVSFTPPRPQHLGQIHARLKAIKAKTVRQRDMASALVTFGRGVGLRLEDIAADTVTLQRLLGAVGPCHAGVSAGRWTGVKSLVRAALVAADIEVLPGRNPLHLDGEWLALAEKLPEQRMRVGLSRAMRYFQGRGWSPSQITLERFEEFHTVLKTKSLSQKPETIYRVALRYWNRAAAEVAGWPQRVFEVPPDPRRYSLDWDAFPETFRREVETLSQTTASPNPFTSTAKAVRPATVKGRRKTIRQIASHLVASGFPVDDVVSLAVLAEPGNLERALTHAFNQGGGEKRPQFENVARLMVTIAKYHLGPERPEQVAALKRIANQLHIKKAGIVQRNRIKLRQFDLDTNLQALLQLPRRVFREADRRCDADEKVALRVMFALAVEILTVAPMRVRNLTSIEVGRHLIVFRRGKGRSYHIVFAPDETKTNLPFEVELGPDTQKLLERYLDKYRPMIAKPGDLALFPSRIGKVRSTGAFSRMISRFIAKETGLAMHPHLFRQLAGKLYLATNPTDIETVRQILGHCSTKTTLRAYAEVRTDLAFKSYDAVVTAQRQALACFQTPVSSQREM